MQKTLQDNYDTLDDTSFRRMVSEFVEELCPRELRHQPRRMRRAEVQGWINTLAAHGWIAPAWPKDYGGMGLSVAKQIAFHEEFDRLGVPRTPDMGAVMIGPLLIKYGTEEQKARFLPPIVQGKIVWCQGYSEPNAGSDLASLRTEAIDAGDHYVVSGQKAWTTLAQDADWIFLLVRTDKTAKKQAGISFLVADLNTPGITRRSIRTLSGEEEFCETFFDDVRVPKTQLVGKVNDGWTMAKALLGFERIFLGSPKLPQVAMTRLDLLAEATGALHDERFLDRYSQLHLDLADLAETYAQFVEIVKRGETLGPDVSILKLVATATYQKITELALETAAEQGVLRGEGTYGNDKLDALSAFYLSRPSTIYGGSSEVQKNILAKNVLDLPDA
ncbi:MAG: acyl-CoA dehydrogenase family protein [Beijerinckiaceae bacterium]